MKMDGTERIPAPREAVWEALNDPEVLRACIPGCQSLERDGEGFNATVQVKMGPVKANFAGEVELQDIVPSESYTIVGSGKGGVAGHASGSSRVRLADAEAGETELRYDVEAQVGGKIAQLGSRLIDSSARKLAGQFFANLRQHFEGGAA